MLHYIQGNKANAFTKIHWTLNATTEECKTKTRCYTIFRETRQVLSPRYIDTIFNETRQVFSLKGKCFNQDTLDFECYNQGV